MSVRKKIETLIIIRTALCLDVRMLYIIVPHIFAIVSDGNNCVSYTQ